MVVLVAGTNGRSNQSGKWVEYDAGNMSGSGSWTEVVASWACSTAMYSTTVVWLEAYATGTAGPVVERRVLSFPCPCTVAGDVDVDVDDAAVDVDVVVMVLELGSVCCGVTSASS